MRNGRLLAKVPQRALFRRAADLVQTPVRLRRVAEIDPGLVWTFNIASVIHVISGRSLFLDGPPEFLRRQVSYIDVRPLRQS
jgi:hypothetical protein